MFIDSKFLSTKQKIIRFILLFFILLTLAFIFVQSILPPEIANEESDIASDIITEVVGEDNAVSDAATDNIDKIAHFTEFGLLGFFVTLYVLCFAKRMILSLSLNVAFAMVIAVIDETVQIFSGRTPDGQDVLADVIGFLFISILTCILVFVTWVAKRKKEK